MKQPRAPDAIQPWLCPECKKMGKDTILGYWRDETVQIKHKDIYITFRGVGIITITCPRCGSTIVQQSDQWETVQKILKEYDAQAANK